MAWDFRPPSSGKLPDIPDKLKKWEGLEYRLMVEGVRKTLDNIATIPPNYRGQGYEIAGFAWFQGHKDGGKQEWADKYESNLVNLIKDVRAEFKAPKLPVVIATVGFGGREMKGRYLQILEAQMAVSDPAKHPDFVGNAKSIDTRDFWRSKGISPNQRQGYHYFRNAETCMLVGDALGRGDGRFAETEEGVNRSAQTNPPDRCTDLGAPVKYAGTSLIKGRAGYHSSHSTFKPCEVKVRVNGGPKTIRVERP